MKYDDHQKGKTQLLQIQFNCVSGFVLDYMHLVCLGVMKRPLNFLKKGPGKCRLSNGLISQISDGLLLLKNKIPTNFARQPRSLTELDRWKATEFRQFLLYTGVVVLRDVLLKPQYKHFLTLSIAVRILCTEDEEKRGPYVKYAGELLKFFVLSAKEYYGELFTVYNVHSLIHLHEDVLFYNSPLDKISSIPFENFMQTLKKYVRSSSNPIVQVAKRQSELNSIGINEGPKIVKYAISLNFKDSFYIDSKGKYVLLKSKIGTTRYVCKIIKDIYLEDFFQESC